MCGRYQKVLANAFWPNNKFDHELIAKRGCKKCMRAYERQVREQMMK